MKSKDTEIKKVKGFSSAYPNICNIKLLTNIDETWITIQDDVGTSMTIKLSDISDFICLRCDSISRQAVLMELDKYLCGVPFDEKGIDEVIKELPPVAPEQKRGKWILVYPLQEDNGGDYMCSECKCGHPYISPNWKYCPNCGARMEEGG